MDKLTGAEVTEGGPCPNCKCGRLRKFAHDYHYHYLKCTNPKCEKERLVMKTVHEGLRPKDNDQTTTTQTGGTP